MQYYLEAFKNYANFQGRATRKEFWMFILFNAIVTAVLYGLGFKLHGFLILYFIYAIGAFIPSLALEVRRLHDTNKSGWMILLSLIPLVGEIIVLIFFCQASTEDNRFGSKKVA